MSEEQKSDSRRKVLVIGLDGAVWDLMDPWIEQGHLPNLAALRDAGASGDLLSTVQPVTTPAWISFMTGCQQGKHSVYDHIQQREASYTLEIMDATRIGSPLIFDYVANAGGRSISINMPLTFPPPRIEGLMVGGLFGTLLGPGITNPPELYDRIREIAPDYVVHPDYNPRAQNALEQYVADLMKSIDERSLVADRLLAEEAWDLGIVVYTATDQIQHAFWREMAEGTEQTPFHTAILDVYKRIDQNLPRLLQHVDEKTLVLVMSDHGAGALHGFVNINRWLADHGLLAFKTGSGNVGGSALITKAASLYKKYMPVGLRAAIRKNMQDQFTQAKARMESELFAAAIDWSRTRAYSIGAGGNIFINRSGPGSEGTVDSDEEYEELRTYIIEHLSMLGTPDGGPLVKEVLRREEVYHGPYLDKAPDLVITWHDYGWWGRARYNQSKLELFELRDNWDFSSLPLTGSHRPQGVVIATGPGIAAGQDVQGAKLIDLAPTILAYMHGAVPRNMDGRALQELFDHLPVTYHDDDADGSFGQGDFQFSDEEEAIVNQHLRDLGYI